MYNRRTRIIKPRHTFSIKGINSSITVYAISLMKIQRNQSRLKQTVQLYAIIWKQYNTLFIMLILYILVERFCVHATAKNKIPNSRYLYLIHVSLLLMRNIWASFYANPFNFYSKQTKECTLLTPLGLNFVNSLLNEYLRHSNKIFIF